MAAYRIRNAGPDDRDAVAALIRDSTNSYYAEQLGAGPIFPPDSLHTRDFVDLYDALDGSESLLCVDGDGVIAGSCFVHRRDTHFSLGIMNVAPTHFGQGIARMLLGDITARADAAGLPLRLVSSCFNLASYSLYTRMGFVPFEFYQDIQIAVPESGIPMTPRDVDVRPATLADVDAIAELELSISGISRRSDYRHFISSPDGLWHMSVAFDGAELVGYLTSGSSQACNMIGPGVARHEDAAAALVETELDRHRGRKPVMLIPGRFNTLVQHLYRLGGRNCELHVGQCYGNAATPNGVTMPTFLPETG
jgi:GNAT superfamily N-acetyltransferase